MRKFDNKQFISRLWSTLAEDIASRLKNVSALFFPHPLCIKTAATKTIVVLKSASVDDFSSKIKKH